MGLIKAAVGAVGSTLHDQWKEAIRCEDLPNDVLMVRKTTKDGVISNGSTVIVGPGQCAIIFDNGKILDATAEEGYYTFDTSSTPSLFAGQFGGMFKEMWERFTYNGVSAKQQAVFFFNIKEIMDNKFGTPNPVPYKDWEHAFPNPRTGVNIPMSVNVRCFGRYTFKISDPFLFMSQISGTADVYRKDDLTEQMRAEVIGAFSNVMNSLGGDYKIPVLDLPSKTDEIKQIMDKNVFDEPIRKRGISLVSFVVESVTLDDKSQEKINNYEIGGDTYQQRGVLTGAYANAIQDAAKNEGGAMNGFVGVGMMNMATNGVTGGVAQGPWNQNPAPVQSQNVNNNNVAQNNTSENSVTDPLKEAIKNDSQNNNASNNGVVVNNTVGTNNGEWECPNCHSHNQRNFCPRCGTKRPEVLKKFCSNCGNELKDGAKFCSECGTKVE